MLSAKWMIVAAAINGFLAVSLGAFGAHGLKARLAEDMLAIYQTGVQYHMYHALALGLVGLLALRFPQSGALSWSGTTFLLGILVFSGSLYVLSLSGIRWLGAITPLGGLAFLVGWLLLAYGAAKAVD